MFSSHETPRSYRELRFPEGYCPGASAEMVALYRQVKMLSRGDAPVLLLGETGVGKEMIAHTLHASSPRRDAPFVAINACAIPAELIEAELFGVGKGVATGVEPRPGIFQRAARGTLFFDEIGEMAPVLQAKLLRALQEKEIHPVGAPPRRVDVRILAATNADLSREMAAGRFRRDLFYRLAGFTLEVPPLRRCQADIPALVEHFLESFSRHTGTAPRGVSREALHLLVDYPWPGNVRELEHEVRRLVYQASPDQVIDSSLVSPQIRVACDPGATAPDSPATGPQVPVVADLENPAADDLALAPRVRDFETAWISKALSRAGGNKTRAAKLLRLSRNGLLKKMRRLGVTIEP